MAFKVAHCIYNLRDRYGNVVSCPVLGRIGEAVKVEDMPRYCEPCPMRIASLGPPPRWAWVGGPWVGKWALLNPEVGAGPRRVYPKPR